MVRKRSIFVYRNRNINLGLSAKLDAGGVKCEEQPSPSVPTPQQSILKDDPSKPLIGLVAPYSSATESNGQTRVSTLKQPTPPSPMAKQFYGSTAHNGVESSGETQARNGRPRVDARGRNQLLPRYWPRITDQELQQISGEYPFVSNIVNLYIVIYEDNCYYIL